MNINIYTPLNETTGSDILAGCLFPSIGSPPWVSDWRILALNKSHRLEVMGNPSSRLRLLHSGSGLPIYAAMPHGGEGSTLSAAPFRAAGSTPLPPSAHKCLISVVRHGCAAGSYFCSSMAQIGAGKRTNGRIPQCHHGCRHASCMSAGEC